MKVAEKSTIVPNDKAELVRKVFIEIAKDERAVNIIRQHFFDEGLVGRNGKILTKSYYYRMLNNPVYMGWIVKFGERHKGTFEPIVSEELFEQIQRILKRRSHRSGVYQRENPDFPLRRFVHHRNGIKLTGGWSQGRKRKYAYYRFIGIQKTDYKKEQFENKYMSFINKFRLDPIHIKYFKKALVRSLRTKMFDEVKQERNSRHLLQN